MWTAILWIRHGFGIVRLSRDHVPVSNQERHGSKTAPVGDSGPAVVEAGALARIFYTVLSASRPAPRAEVLGPFRPVRPPQALSAPRGREIHSVRAPMRARNKPRSGVPTV